MYISGLFPLENKKGSIQKIMERNKFEAQYLKTAQNADINLVANYKSVIFNSRKV